MIKNKNIYRIKDAVLRIASVLLTLMFALMLAVPDFAYAAEEEPIREAHKVGVGNTLYCFFVTQNVILTPSQVAGMTDEELTDYILDEAGLYMKKSNCKSSKNDKVISVKSWKKKNGAFYLTEPDLKSIRAAAPSDGNPSKFYMDLLICENVGNKKKEETGKTDKDKEKEKEKEKEEAKAAEEKDEAKTAEESGEVKAAEESEETKPAEEKDATDPAEEKDKAEPAEKSEEAEEPEEHEDLPLYTTFKRNEPALLFVAVATDADAAIGEDLCRGEQSESGNTKTPTEVPSISESVEPESEMLPEYRSINMVDRSGKPVKATLEEGDPVKLEWVEQKNNSGNEGGKSFIDRIPGGITGFVIICAAAAAAVTAAAVMAGKKKRADL